ncbi:MAG: peptidyl-prolyl cis-trans isomerase [Verrucomicrobiales bacterium]
MLFVNGEPVAPELIEGEFRAIKSHAESLGNISCCERDPEFRAQARDNVIARVLLNQESHRRSLEVTDDEIDAALARIEEEHGGREALLGALGLHPCQITEVRADIANGLRVEKTLRTCLGPLPEPTEDEVRAFYEAHLADYLSEEEARATHLFKQVERSEDRQRIYDDLRELRRRARAGEDFSKLAHDHTDKEDKLTDLGWFKQRDFMDEFSTIVFSLEEQEMSPVFASYFGLHLTQCTGRRPPTPLPFGDVRDAVRQRIIADDQQAKSRELVNQLREHALIEDREETETPAA